MVYIFFTLSVYVIRLPIVLVTKKAKWWTQKS